MCFTEWFYLSLFRVSIIRGSKLIGLTMRLQHTVLQTHCCTHVLVVAWARVPYGSYWHSCDVLPEGRRPRGHSHNCANNSHMVTREAQATTNLLPVPGKVRLSKLPKPQPARCTLFPRIQLSVPHGIYWHTSYGVLRVCYFTLRATR